MYDEILVETEQINNETEQQVSEINRFWLRLTGNDIGISQKCNFGASLI